MQGTPMLPPDAETEAGRLWDFSKATTAASTAAKQLNEQPLRY
jgi:hypothetical protein